MAAAVTGSKTCTNNVSPTSTAAALTTLLAIAVENMTVAQFRQIYHALAHVSGGEAEARTIGSLLI